MKISGKALDGLNAALKKSNGNFDEACKELQKAAEIKQGTYQEPCDCLGELDQKLRDKLEIEISPKCKMLSMDKGLALVWGIPFARENGKPLRRADPKFYAMIHCPMCGSKLPQAR